MTTDWPPPGLSGEEDALERARQDLFHALAGLKEEHCRAHAEPGQPSVQEALAALVAFERLVEAAIVRNSDMPSALPVEESAEAHARGNQLMLPALIHDLNAARHATIGALAYKESRMRERVEAALLPTVAGTVARIERNAELLGLR